MIDTHAHLNWPEYAKNLDKVITESKQAGLTGIIVTSSNLADSQKSIELVKQFPGFLFACVGIHPQQTDTENTNSIESQLTVLENLIISTGRPPAALQGDALQGYIPTAVGECGLDFSPAPPGENNRSKNDQIQLFIGQITIAQKFGLPLVIHTRDAFEETMNTLTSILDINIPNIRGVIHCYTGGRKRIKRVLELPGDWYFGFDGNLTYEDGLVAVIKDIPVEKIVIETDSPFLTPIPHRGEVNCPAYLPFIQKRINAIFGRDLSNQIETNSRKLFGI